MQRTQRATRPERTRSARPAVFLGGPIQHAMSAAGFRPDLRETIERAIACTAVAGFRVLSTHAVERFGEIDVSASSGVVTARDMGWMRECELFACFLPPDPTTGWSLRTDGTCVQLGWASALGKPIVIVRDAAAEHSHLIAGLHAVAQVRYIDYGAVAREPQALVSAIRGALGRPEAAGAAR